ncbi:MAG: alpha/beta fold hydrolase [Rhodobacteraceae bacterium]|nr:alpha/beta fold hydrolase [Paracoccaceae bacterium]
MSEILNFVSNGDGAGPRLLIAHGLFGTARNWGVLAKRLADERRVVSVDMRNHGGSFQAASNTYGDMAEDLARVIETGSGKSDVLGHSMGGKAAMVLALARPDLVDKLIVADIAPVAYSHSQLDKITAMKAVDLSVVERRRDADAQLVGLVEDPALRSFLLQSLSLDEGGASWKLNLEALGSAMDDIIGFPDIEGAFEGEVLFLHGVNSDYVQPAHHAKILALFPNARFEEIEGAGHWLHAEKPREFEASVRRFLG